MRNVIISDTSCLIVLSSIGELGLLQGLYGTIITTPKVAEEFGEPLPDWVIIEPLQDVKTVRLLEMQIDSGEASAIAMAMEYEQCTLILDDNKARKVAIRLGLRVTGTVGIIVSAKSRGLISSVKPLIEQMKNAGFRISDDLELQALVLAGEVKSIIS